MTPQAKRLVDAVAALGCDRRGFSVRTLTYSRRGIRHYGNAYLTCYRREVSERVLQAAPLLRSAGFMVDVFEVDGRRHVSVAS
jgi:hypothetical protein